jgi:hypothetical protein
MKEEIENFEKNRGFLYPIEKNKLKAVLKLIEHEE